MKEWFIIFTAIIAILFISAVLSYLLNHWAYYVTGGVVVIFIIVGFAGGKEDDTISPK